MRKNLEADHFTQIAIIEKAQAGDKDAFGQLFDLYFKKIFGYLRVRTGDYQNAEDLTEIVFLKAWEHLPSFKIRKGKDQFQAWLFRIARNTLIDHYRKNKKEVSLDESDKQIPDDGSLEGAALKYEREQRLTEAIRSLDELSQHVIIYRFISGLSHRETAQALNISEGNVRVIQFRALKKMKGLLREDDV